MGDEKFRLPGSSYEEIVKIVRAYAKLDREATLEEVVELTAMHRTIISRNNGFLISMGIIAEGQKKSITAQGKILAQALDYELQLPERVRDAWRDLIFNNEFMRKILDSIKIRKQMEISTLQAHIAYTAGQPKKSDVMTGVRTIIDILDVAELILTEDGKISINESEKPEDHSTPSGYAIEVSTDRGVTFKSEKKAKEGIGLATGMTLMLNININCDANDLDVLPKKIRQLIKEINNPEKENGPIGDSQ
jgi:hypothetical protein